MKTINYLILTVVFIGFLSCNKEETAEIYTAEVENYVELLKTNHYESMDLPDFSYKHIPFLLMYINDTSVVNKFPHGVSSYHEQNPDYRLGILVLWTIESIRAVSCGDTHNLRFPSQHPFIQFKKEPFTWIIDHDDEAYKIVRKVYSDWWENNKNKKFSDFDDIDPLSETEYRWH
jgi:hypothetical protein